VHYVAKDIQDERHALVLVNKLFDKVSKAIMGKSGFNDNRLCLEMTEEALTNELSLVKGKELYLATIKRNKQSELENMLKRMALASQGN
jgi:hypothetical protein